MNYFRRSVEFVVLELDLVSKSKAMEERTRTQVHTGSPQFTTGFATALAIHSARPGSAAKGSEGPLVTALTSKSGGGESV
jgi:hypothetical protein